MCVIVFVGVVVVIRCVEKLLEDKKNQSGYEPLNSENKAILWECFDFEFEKGVSLLKDQIKLRPFVQYMRKRYILDSGFTKRKCIRHGSTP